MINWIKTKWAIIASGALAIYIILLNLRISSLNKDKKLLEDNIEEATDIAEEQEIDIKEFESNMLEDKPDEKENKEKIIKLQKESNNDKTNIDDDDDNFVSVTA